MKRLTASIAVTLLCAVVLAAQAKPNFVGKWVPTDPSAAQGMGGLGSLATVAQDDKTFKVTSVVAQMGEITTAYNLDGSEGKSNLDFNGTAIERTTRLKWDGNKLILTAVSSFQGAAFETTQTWTLDASGNLVVELTRPDFQGGGAPVTTKATYKKQT